MAETSRPWSGTTIGDAGGYTDDNWTDVWERFLGAVADADTGVLSNVGNELVVTGAATPLSVNTGWALNNGTFYENTAVVTVAVPTPGVAVRIDRIVLRKDWALQTVRIFRLAGIEGGGAPALVQVDGTTWDIPLFQASINLGGVITLTDERERLFTRIPSMTTAERDAMTPINGMYIYNSTDGQHQGYEGGAWRARVAANFQRIIASGNWTKPINATHVFVQCIGAGGGGSGGEGQVAGNDRVGGGGGGGGASASKMFDAAVLGAVEAVTIGAGGVGGAGGTGADGANGGVGGNTDFGTLLYAYGGGLAQGGGAAGGDGGGGGGSGGAGINTSGGLPQYGVAVAQGDALAGHGAQGGVGAGAADTGNRAEYGGAGGGSGAQTPAAGITGGGSLYGAGGGGSGGGLPVGNNENVGGAGGVGGSYSLGGGGAGGAVNGGPGGAGAAATDDECGDGGGGGGSQDAGNGGAGGVGGAPGGGGGGGGGGTNTGGAGGAGGRGEVRVWSW